MYTPKNPFPIISQNVDLTKHRDMINKNIEKSTSDFNKIFKTIDEQQVKDTFWNLAEGRKEYDPLNWYHVYAILLGRFAGMQALMEEGKISKEMYFLHREWSTYLTTRVGPHHFKIPKSFLQLLTLKKSTTIKNCGTELNLSRQLAIQNIKN